MRTNSTDHNNNLNKTIDKYNADAQQAYMRTLLGDEIWERHKPTKNLRDFVSGTANDNTVR